MNLHDRDIMKRAREEGIELGISQGISQGVSQKAVEAAEMFLREGDSVEKVSRCIGLPLDQIQEIADRICNS